MKNRKQFLSVLLSGFLVIGTLQGPFFTSSVLQVPTEARMAAADSEEEVLVMPDEAGDYAAESDETGSDGYLNESDEDVPGEEMTEDTAEDVLEDSTSGNDDAWQGENETEDAVGDTAEPVSEEQDAVREDTSAEEAGDEETEISPKEDPQTEAAEQKDDTVDQDRRMTEDYTETIPVGESVSTEAQNSEYVAPIFDIQEGTLVHYNGTGGDVVVPSGVTTIYYDAFKSCKGLKSVKLPEGLRVIEDYAFYDCTNLKKVILPDSLREIGYHAFGYCTSLESISIPGGVSDIGYCAFERCTSLKNLTISEGVKSLGNHTFLDCTSLTSITLPQSVEEVNNSFAWCSNIRNIKASLHIINSCFGNLNPSNPVNVELLPGIINIPSLKFSHHEDIGSLIIPEGVTKIDEYAIRGCNNLTSVSLPDGLESIGYEAFEGCENLSIINLPDSIVKIDQGAFLGCSSLKSITLPKCLKFIEKETFRGCTNLTSITFQEGLEEIGEKAFYYCTSLESLSFPNSLISIGMMAFSYCDNLTSVTNMDGVTELGGGIFEESDKVIIYCSSESDELMDYAAWNSVSFYGDVPYTVEGNVLVSYNRSGGDVVIPDGVEIIGMQAFSRSWELTDITIPDEVTEIWWGAFRYCKNLRNVILSKNLSEIGLWAFENCNSLKEIVIPESVEWIYGEAFSDCVNLSKVSIMGKDTEFDESAFRGADQVVIYCYECASAISIAESLDIPYVVNVRSLSDEDVTLSQTIFTYDGKAKKPAVYVVIDEWDEWLLEEGTNYKVSYTSNTNAGTASVKVTGIGFYTGSIIKKFTIRRAAQAFRLTAPTTMNVGKTAAIKVEGVKETSSVTYSSSNINVAVVSKDGIVTAKNPGTVTITAATPQTANYSAGTKSVTIKVLGVQLVKPGNCRFVKWNNAKYNSCVIAWNKVAGAEGYETLLSWTNGTHASKTTVKANVLSRTCLVATNHVSQMKVRAFYKKGGTTVYGPWSNVAFITPSPSKLTTKNVSSSSKDLKVKISWNIIYGCNGYNVFVTTNPNGNWNWNQSTAIDASSTSAVITKCNGKLKKNTRYYVRIVTRRKQNGVFCTVPMPAKNTYVGSFVIK